MGSVSGSSVANTVSTGVITIPMMKKAGFPARFAAGVEAAASTGGQLMPPVMGLVRSSWRRTRRSRMWILLRCRLFRRSSISFLLRFSCGLKPNAWAYRLSLRAKSRL
ncbi:TRAP transporter large permease [Vibrio cholerae]|nr:TRAP transporter large permease [Vibrio cholerae]